MRNNRWFCFCLVGLLFLASCAKMVTPTGGPRDMTPPTVTKVEPENGTVHFNNKVIKITFDEYVELNNPIENAIFSPPLLENPEFVINGKTVSIKIKDSLKSNITYNVVLSDCIKDFTEGNKLSYYHYTFSTGAKVDSFALHGTVTNAKTLEPENGCLVLLYEEDIDSLPVTTRPVYITKTQSDGKFMFENIAEKSYKIFALKDINSNLIYDLPNEGIAYLSGVIPSYKMDIDDSTHKVVINDSTSIALQLFIAEDTIQKLVKATCPQKGKYIFHYKLPVYDFSPEIVNGRTLPDHFEVRNQEGDSIIWYMKTMPEDTIIFTVEPSDNKIDTLKITPFKKAKTASRGSRFTQRTAGKEAELQVTSSHEGDLFSPLYLHFSYPIRPIDSFEVTFIGQRKNGSDTTIQKYSVPDTIVTTLPLTFKWQEKVPYIVQIQDSVFFGYDGSVNDSISLRFTTKSEKDYGILTIEYQPDTKDISYIVMLISEKDAIVQQNIICTKSSIHYANLLPGKYRIKVIEDRNNNGRWDSGNYSTKTQPEKIFFFNKPIDIKGFWELEETFDFKEQRVKNEERRK